MTACVCAVCGRGPAIGVTVYRMNEKGGPPLWSCNEHKDRFDGRIDPDVMELVKILTGGKL